MASAGTIRAGKAAVEIGIVGSLKAGLDKGLAELKAWGAATVAIGAQVGAAGAALSAPLMFAIHEFRNAGTELLDLNAATGVSVERLGALQQAAVRLGGSTAMVSRGLQSVGNFMVSAAQGAPEALRAISMLGLSFRELQGMSPDRQFLRIGDALRRIPNDFQRAQVAQQIFGDGSGQLLRILARGSGEWERLAQQARQAGQVMSGPDAAAAGALTAAWNTMTSAVGALWQKIGGALAPSFTVLLNLLTAGISWVTRWADENRTLFRVIDLTATGLTVLGVILTSAGGAAVAASFLVGGLAAAVGMAGSAIVAVGGFLASMVGSLIAFGVALVPMLPLIALVGAGLALIAAQVAVGVAIWAAAAYAIYAYWDDITAAVGKAADAVMDFANEINEAMFRGQRAVYDGMVAVWDKVISVFPMIGDAADAAWEGIKRGWGALVGVGAYVWRSITETAALAWGVISEGWRVATSGIGDLFTKLGATFGEVWGGIVSAVGSGDLRGAFEIAVAGAKLLWVQATNFLQEKWLEFTGFIQTGFEEAFASVVAAVKTAWNEAIAWMWNGFIRLMRQANVISADQEREQLRGVELDRRIQQGNINRDLTEALNPERESVRQRREHLEGVRAENRQAEAGARGELEGAQGRVAHREFENFFNQTWQNVMGMLGGGERAQAAPIGRLEGIRGTFSGAALGGLGGGGNPVVDAIREQTNRQAEQQQTLNQILAAMQRMGLNAG